MLCGSLVTLKLTSTRKSKEILIPIWFSSSEGVSKLAVKEPGEITVVTTSDVTGEVISETYGYVSSTYLSYFILNKSRAIEKALDFVYSKIQYEAFKDGADAIVCARTSLETQSQYWLFTRVNVFMEGTMVIFDTTD